LMRDKQGTPSSTVIRNPGNPIKNHAHAHT
jgi:hypothetical protein